MLFSNNFTWSLLLLSFLVVFGCASSEVETGSFFTQLSKEQSGLDFSNDLAYVRDFNIYTYRNFYNGGGVGIGDVNGDDLPDIYLTANMGPNKLFINEGEMKFRDVTAEAGVAGTRGWSTGVSMADVNADGMLDIYVCNSGKLEGDDRANELFINQGDGTFIEQAAAFGLDDRGLSTHAAFFDYDHDGDVDVYLLNNSFRPITTFNLSENQRPFRDSLGGDKLLRNEGDHFTDVSDEAGIYGSVIGFGLGVTVGDIDLDGWLDIYVSNDFFERDYLYINQQDGTFKEELTDRIDAISAASMGADMADLTGDGYPEIFVTDMLPATDKRLKINTTFESWDNYVNKLEHGYYHQFTRNTLQLNRKDGSFSEVSRALNADASDWSWGALLVDLDSDGDRDVFVANGIYQDLTNQDYISFLASEQTKKQVTATGEVDFEMLIDLIPSEAVPNVVFENHGGVRMHNAADKFGLGDSGFSNGSAYGDLDNDGDLDLVVNNVNSDAWLYRNDQPRDSLHHSLLINLKGQSDNPLAIGTRVVAYTGNGVVSAEQIPNRGFQSSVDNRLFIGLGEYDEIDSLLVYWPTGKITKETNIPAGRLSLTEPDKSRIETIKRPQKSMYQQVDIANIGIDFTHEENTYVDFDRERLIYQMLSTAGPCIAVADINGDGKDDLYLGGAKDQAGQLYVQQAAGTFKKWNSKAISSDARSEDVDAHFFDADNDGDQDLLVASGSSEFGSTNFELLDRLYYNDGSGNFTEASRAQFSAGVVFTSCFALGDVDADGDLDIFQGARSRPNLYGAPAPSGLFINDKGVFKRTPQPLLDSLGLVTDAVWADMDGDGVNEFVVLRDWDSPVVMSVNHGLLELKETLPDSLKGWWTCITATDIDSDGDTDFLLGNLGVNSRLRASASEPVTMHVNDFDRNGTPEQIISRYINGESLPISLRHDVVMQMPQLKKKYLKYDSYHGQAVQQMFDSVTLSRSLFYNVTEQRSGVLINNGKKGLRFEPFSFLGQLSPIYAFGVLPQGNKILAGGNLYGVKPELGRYDASAGEVIGWQNNSTLVNLASTVGLSLKGEIRDIEVLVIDGVQHILVARNNDVPLLFRMSGHEN